MNNNIEVELSREEREGLDNLSREKAPPEFLEQQVVSALKDLDLIRSPRPFGKSWRVMRIALPIAASLLLFVLGALIGANWQRQPSASNSPQFMLLLRSAGGTPQVRSSEEIKRIVREYGDWASKLNQEGLQIEGEKLKKESRVLRPSSYAESEPASQIEGTAVNGFFLIGAPDYDQAVRIASDCPHLKYGGSIEVRQIE